MMVLNLNIICFWKINNIQAISTAILERNVPWMFSDDVERVLDATLPTILGDSCAASRFKSVESVRYECYRNLFNFIQI